MMGRMGVLFGAKKRIIGEKGKRGKLLTTGEILGGGGSSSGGGGGVWYESESECECKLYGQVWV